MKWLSLFAGANALAITVFLGSAQAVSAPPAPAHKPDDLAVRFGALEDYQSVALSPDGMHLVLVVPMDNGAKVVAIDLAQPKKPVPVLGVKTDEGDLRSCVWTTDTRIVCQVRFAKEDGNLIVGYSRMFAINADGTGLVQLSLGTNLRSHYALQDGGRIIDYDIGENPGSVLVTRTFVPDSQTGTRMGTDKTGLGVELVDTLTLQRRTVEWPRLKAAEYITDGHGAVRIVGDISSDGLGMLRNRRNYFFRAPGSRDWQPLSVVKGSAEGYSAGFDPYAVDSAANVVYGFDAGADGFQQLHSLSLDGQAIRKVVLSRPDTDVDSLIRIGRDRRVVGASYATDRRTVEYFDPDLKRLIRALNQALPGNPGVFVIDASKDETRLLVLASSDTDPGVLYLYDKKARRLDQVMLVRSPLEGLNLAPKKPMTYQASDGTTVPAYLTLPPGSDGKGLPAIVMPHGGPSARDEWGFDWLVQYFAQRGYAVIQPNYRGSAGYGTAWFQKNGFQSWKSAISDVNDAGRWMVAQGIAHPRKLAAVGWSYGGYASLQGAVVDPDLFKAVVAIAPVTDFASVKREAEGFVNADIVAAYVGSGAHIVEGSPAQNAARIKAPVLLFHGDFDENVRIAQSRLMADMLRKAGGAVTLVEFPGLAHGLESRQARARMLRESDAFLRKHLGCKTSAPATQGAPAAC